MGTLQCAFAGLPFAEKEVDGIAAIIPGTTKLLDKAFNLDAVVPKLNDITLCICLFMQQTAKAEALRQAQIALITKNY